MQDTRPTPITVPQGVTFFSGLVGTIRRDERGAWQVEVVGGARFDHHSREQAVALAIEIRGADLRQAMSVAAAREARATREAFLLAEIEATRDPLAA